VTAYSVKAWSEFALGHLGASAALLGLVFVSVSINLAAIMRSGQLINRAGETVVLLGGVLLMSTAVLIPDEPDATGAALIALGIVLCVAVAGLQQGPRGAKAAATQSGTPMFAVVMRRVSGLGAATFAVVAGVSLLATGGGGLYWWAAAVALSYFGALTGAWVLLIEILR
jgi:modulator of FtsH protease